MLEQLESALTGLLRLADIERGSQHTDTIRDRVFESLYRLMDLRRPVIPAGVVESFKKLGVEICIEVGGNPVWVVPAATGQDRIEITSDAIGLLLHCQESFGGKVVRVEMCGEKETV